MRRRKTHAELYAREFQKELNRPASTVPRSREEIEDAIRGIGEQLKRPMHDSERLCLVGDRAALRKQLAEMDSCTDRRKQ